MKGFIIPFRSDKHTRLPPEIVYQNPNGKSNMIDPKTNEEIKNIIASKKYIFIIT